MVNQLIILGNGFDLSANLKTKYSDFFDYLLKEMGEVSFLEEKPKGCKSYIYRKYKYSNGKSKFKEMFNFWSGFFTTLSTTSIGKKLQWMDVEGNIKEVVTLISKNYGEYSVYQDLLNLFEEDIEPVFNNKSELMETYFKDWIHFLIEKNVKSAGDANDILDILISDLNKFEKQFSEYLCENVINKEISCIEDTNNRLYKRRQFLLKIVRDGFSHTPTEDTQILNFNYTPIYQRELGGDHFNLGNEIKYIHGRLEWDEEKNNFKAGSVIFGIDDTNLVNQAGNEDESLEEKLYKFGKTYRILNSEDNTSLNLENKIDLIKFYGHSLNTADYAYFQSIFDKVDLYGSNVKLCFYYGDFEKNCDENKKKFMDRIYKLIETYGQNTFKNNFEIRGKNLLHKLILEGRIKTCYIK
ncbi:AbiH family protein [Pediococcus acidilactici]|uniref:AbiH family protein n=1 Tax=Pediococcus acidilactici TaxID=1254 RepID=UPI00232D8579|nr:AbiH family protein [Pediococcus acidilactici]MDB8858793.1 AbiH family protein [Pediococcus acidilactici]MDB8861083.1 AbiH family protein [Pediococcus acidilactici]MDB8862025.1 AbiH family protein [Pediococcus acidilactici]MDB8865974.1 AbiH family protein [Pediococcus acidilactici]